MSFQIHALPATSFQPLFELDDEALIQHHARRVMVDAQPGYPCRISLTDCDIGERVLLVNFQHQPGDSPFQSAHAVIVRDGAEQATPEPDEIPELLTSRLLSIRSFNAAHDLLDAEVLEGSSLAERLSSLLQDPNADYVHIHNAARGCYLAGATRASRYC